MPSKILITGGTGLVGRRLAQKLKERKNEVRILTTSAVHAVKSDAFYWNPKDRYVDRRAFVGIDYIIHLAGASLADERWTTQRKKLIYESRVSATYLLQERSKENGIKGIIAASAIGFYGMDTGDHEVDEKSKCGNDFLSNVVIDWEEAIDSFSETMEQVVKFRLGVVLDPSGGALKKIAKPVRYGVGTPLGNGKQWMSWIHVEDLVKMILFALETKLSGTYNAVAPNAVTNEEFTKLVARQFHRPLWLPNVPRLVLRIFLGELAQVVLGSSKVRSKKIEKEKFDFEYPRLDMALLDLLK